MTPTALTEPFQLQHAVTKHRDLIVEEYKALRAESLRCAQIISSTIWVGVTGLLVTAAAGTAALGHVNQKSLFVVVLTLLCLQSFGASAMFLSEYWKYIRVGIYIRTRIEPLFEVPPSQGGELNASDAWRPLNWEHWIQDKRTAWFAVASLLVLQFPVITAIVLIAYGGLTVTPTSMIEKVGAGLFGDKSLFIVLVVVVLFDVFAVGIMVRSLRKEVRALSSERLSLTPRLLTYQPKK